MTEKEETTQQKSLENEERKTTDENQKELDEVTRKSVKSEENNNETK